ncbi:MAG: sigma-54 dependent transcriptional regulator [bacterium]|nr:sigma-54 dependent transcriptional regulator [bacterium]
MKKRILVVEDDPKMARILQIALEQIGYEPLAAGAAEGALEILGRKRVDLVLTDLHLPGGMSGIDLLVEMRHRELATPVVIITAYGTIDSAVEAMRAGASDFILKPFDVGSIEVVISRVLEFEKYKRENVFLREELTRQGEEIIGQSPKMREIYALVERIAPTDVSVLIRGETGTGKEIIARTIHEKSPRREKLFVAVNCAAIPTALLESELFGHVKGAFTGANVERTGRFEKADGGSIFFDEIGDMEPVLQAKILRVLQEKEFEKVGSTETISVNVRLITATNRDLARMIGEGTFRKDLYYRLNVVDIVVPPLRERAEDIPLLAEHFTRKYGREWGKEVQPPTEEVIGALQAYPWPGNVREMENVIERAVALCTSGQIGLEDLPPEIIHGVPGEHAAGPPPPEEGHDLEGSVAGLEREMIGRALAEAGGIKARAARLLGISERNLWYKIKKYRIS